MTPAQLATYVRFKTKTDANTFPDADILVLANIEKDDIAKEITKANEDYFVIENDRNLEVGKRNYKFPSDMLNNMKTLSATFDGTTWKRLNEYDFNTLKINTDEDSITEYFNSRTAGFAILGGEIIVLNDSAIIAVADGLKLYATVYPADISAMTGTDDMSLDPSATEFGFPKQFHKILAHRISRAYKQRPDSKMKLDDDEKNVEIQLNYSLDSIKGQNLDRSIIPSVPYDDGSDY